MKIRENLVWDKHLRGWIGFVDSGDININYTTLKNVQKLAHRFYCF